MSQEADRRFERLARRQHGVGARWQAVDDGVPHATFDWRVATGRYVELWPGVVLVNGAPDTRVARWMAAVLYVGGEAVIARRSAAELHGLPCPTDGRSHVLVRCRTFEAAPELVVHRTRRLPDHHVTVVDRVPVTAVERTLCDLAGELPFGQLRRAVAHAVRHRQVSAASLRAMVAELGRFRGKRKLAAILDELSPQEEFTRSDLESAFLRVTSAAGIPPTAMNVPVRTSGGRRYVIDALYLPEGLPVELDSETWHGTRLDGNDDRIRENELATEGLRPPLRFSWWDVTRRPELVVEQLHEALHAARSSSSVLL